jgi:glycosyltransferase involved in cell wall biosynthesis
MRFLFLIQDAKMPSSRIRVMNLLPELKKNGLDVSAELYPNNLKDKYILYNRLHVYDCVILQKRLISFFDLFFLRKKTNKIGYDFDDAVYLKDDSAVSNYSISRNIKFTRIMKNVDFVIAGNNMLSRKSLLYKKPTYVLPSSVEIRGKPCKKNYKIIGTLKLGWVGGSNNFNYLRLLSKPLQNLAKEIDFELSIISNKPLKIDGVKTNFIPWDLKTQENEICKLDIGLMPLSNSPFSSGKCSYKALQYMATGVPCILSNVGMNFEVASSGAALLADSIEEFQEKILLLYNNENLRRSFGENGKRIVVENYSTCVISQKMVRILKEIMQCNSENNISNF